MQFTRIKNNRMYPSWVARHQDLRIYIYQMMGLESIYHFGVKKDGNYIYYSLNSKPQIFATEFEEIVLIIEAWLRNNYHKAEKVDEHEIKNTKDFNKFDFSDSCVVGGAF